MVHCDLNPELLKHERFEELCALSAIGELSASEFAEWNEHLSGCEHCRELYADFRRLSSHDIGAVAAGRRYGDESIEAIDEAALLKDVLARAQQERGGASEKSWCPESRKSRFMKIQLGSPLSRFLLRTAGAVACLAAVAAGAYEFGYLRRTPGPAAITANAANPAEQIAPTLKQGADSDQRLQKLQAQRDALQASLAEARERYDAALNQQKILQAEIALAKEQLQLKGDELQSSKSQVEQSDTQVRELQARLRDTISTSESQSLAISELRNKLKKAEQESVLAAAPGLQDADAKNLFGARDLHIVDVYDVDGSGKTKRAFGRVYYAEKKLLLFYAFDLQTKQSARITAGFQAWGYRQGDEDKPRNLGLFLMDDPTISRWVLKVNDTRVLERIDAVFVTLEPPNGSPVPSGRKLLYANLGGPPNHP
jgi:anti-sigma factor RsiW